LTAAPLTGRAALTFGAPEGPDDLIQIRRLTYATFVEEIPQHPPNADRMLIDKWEAENRYVVGRDGARIVAMIAMRMRRPFSLDAKLPDVDRYLPPGRRPIELRLLAVEKPYRGTATLSRLLRTAFGIALSEGYDLAVISGTTRQIRLYEHMGFTAFGPLVGTPGAEYQPMYAKTEQMEAQAGHLLAPGHRDEPAAFQPGPVGLLPSVRQRVTTPPASHRAPAFARDLAAIREALQGMTRARHVAVASGSGTLANDMVAGQIARSGGHTLVIADGEFGWRLVDHARRHRIPHTVLERSWGETPTAEAIDAAMQASGARWLWAVHCETSAGVLHDLSTLTTVARRHGARLALDAVSSIGTVPLDLDGVAYASASSAKGLGAIAGLAIVLAAEAPEPAPDFLPRYLDLALYLHGDGVPFTGSSPLVGALAAALADTDWAARYRAIAEAGEQLRTRLALAGLQPVADVGCATPAVTTLAVPAERDATAVGERLEHEGFLLGWRSEYMRRHRWIQAAMMGAFPRERVGELGDALVRLLG
jgi:aspartate aminotransferase-like enzyme/GNAT superfamily N-acetyltransferase